MAEGKNGANVDIIGDRRLEDIFLEGWEAVDQLDSSKHAPNSIQFQNMVTDGMKSLEYVTHCVSNLDMFSSNETIDEITTSSLKYILLPYFLGKLALRLKREDRAQVLDVAEVYFKDFLKRCENYELTESSDKVEKLKPEGSAIGKTELAELMGAATARNAKIAQYKRKKELEEEVNKIKVAVKSKNCEDELLRNFFMNLIKLSIIDAKEEMSSMNMEQELLKMRPQISQQHSCGDTGVPVKPKAKAPPLRPFIITKNAAQKSVFGMGYPSLPIMTVDEFYEQRVREGIFPDEEKQAKINYEKALAALQDPTEKEEHEKEQIENQIENDDPEYLARMRNMDEYKDVVRRGDGNRHNRS